VIKFINILKEEYDFSLKKPYIHKEGFKGEDTKEVYKFLRSRLELNPDNSSIITYYIEKIIKKMVIMMTSIKIIGLVPQERF
jgi:transcription elongation factor GreA-like protein